MVGRNREEMTPSSLSIVPLPPRIWLLLSVLLSTPKIHLILFSLPQRGRDTRLNAPCKQATCHDQAHVSKVLNKCVTWQNYHLPSEMLRSHLQSFLKGRCSLRTSLWPTVFTEAVVTQYTTDKVPWQGSRQWPSSGCISSHTSSHQEGYPSPWIWASLVTCSDQRDETEVTLCKF